MQHGPGALGECRQISPVRARQAACLGDAAAQALPSNRRLDRGEQIGTALSGSEQGLAEPGEQAHLVVHRSCVAQDGILHPRLGAAEQPAHRTVEQGDAVVGQPGRGVQDGGDQRGAAAWGRQGPQMLRGEAPALAGELAQALRMHAIGASRIEADGAQVGEPLGDIQEGTMPRRTGRLARPGEHAEGGAVLGREQCLQRLGLAGRQVAGQLACDLALGQQHGSQDQALDEGGRG